MENEEEGRKEGYIRGEEEEAQEREGGSYKGGRPSRCWEA